MGQFSARRLARPVVAPPKGEVRIENEQAIALQNVPLVLMVGNP